MTPFVTISRHGISASDSLGVMGRHGGVKRRSSPSGEGGYALGGHAPDPYRHYAIPGGARPS